MSLETFELKKEHILLLKHLRWSVTPSRLLVSTADMFDDQPTLYNTTDIYEGVDLILNGKPEDFDPFNTDEPTKYSDEQIQEWDKLLRELPIALEIILQTQGFALGKYITRHHDRNWKMKLN